MKRILVLRLRYLGDTFLLHPVLRALRAAQPDAHVEALVMEGTGIALAGCPDVSAVREWPRSGLLRQLAAMRRVFRGGWDLVLDLTANDRSSMLTAISGAPVRAGFFKAKQGRWFWRNGVYTRTVTLPHPKPHILEQHRMLLEAVGVGGMVPDFHPAVPDKESFWAETFRAQFAGRRVLHAHLSSRDMQKSVAPDIARRVFAGLPDAVSVVLTHGPGPVETAHAAACAEGCPKVVTVPGLNGTELVALIERCDAYWGCDTAPMHVASAFGKPMLVHFGPSPAHQWRPLSPRAVVDVHRCECLASRKVSCPGGRTGRCLAGLEPAAVVKQLSGILAAGGGDGGAVAGGAAFR